MSKTIPMGKATNPKGTLGVALALLIAAAALLLPEIALADDDTQSVKDYTDTADDRLPAVTAFPEYPSVAQRERIEGEATVCFAIDERGRVIRPSVRSSTHRIFDKAVMAAIRDSSFLPLEAGEEPAIEKTCRTYRFRLDPVNAENDQPDAQPTTDIGASGADKTDPGE
ncbi:MAG TPA: energy transducer TonB [Woeseiaceae bacterium]|nr:energy transducer TonB [Woeseiaceae bacterium]